jgi:hypothetical protein
MFPLNRWVLCAAGIFAMWVCSQATAQESDSAICARVEAKNPRIAAGLSMVVPGLGSVYSGEPVMGGIHLGAFLAAIGMVVAADVGQTSESISTWGWVSISLVAATYVWGVVDAILSAERADDRLEVNRSGEEAGTIPNDARTASGNSVTPQPNDTCTDSLLVSP